MGRKIRIIVLTEEEKVDLEHGYKHGENHLYRMRCLSLLLKSEGLKSSDVSDRTGLCEETINKCMTRWSATKMASLVIKPGRGRRSTLDIENDAQKVREVVQRERQKLKLAKVILEEELGKQFSLKTLKRFLKNLGAVTNEFGGG